jgi:hypothetical protein
LLLSLLSTDELGSAKKIAASGRLTILVRDSKAVGANSQLISTHNSILALPSLRLKQKTLSLPTAEKES